MGSTASKVSVANKASDSNGGVTINKEEAGTKCQTAIDKINPENEDDVTKESWRKDVCLKCKPCKSTLVKPDNLSKLEHVGIKKKHESKSLFGSPKFEGCDDEWPTLTKLFDLAKTKAAAKKAAAAELFATAAKKAAAEPKKTEGGSKKTRATKRRRQRKPKAKSTRKN